MYLCTYVYVDGLNESMTRVYRSTLSHDQIRCFNFFNYFSRMRTYLYLLHHCISTTRIHLQVIIILSRGKKSIAYSFKALLSSETICRSWHADRLLLADRHSFINMDIQWSMAYVRGLSISTRLTHLPWKVGRLTIFNNVIWYIDVKWKQEKIFSFYFFIFIHSVWTHYWSCPVDLLIKSFT